MPRFAPFLPFATLLAVATFYGAVPSRALGQMSSGRLGDSARAASFVSAFAQALARRDRAAVAGMVRYPATAIVGGLAIPIDGRESLLRMYDGVFTSELRCLVEASAGRGRPALRVEPGAVVFGDGRVRAEEADGTFKISRIDVPPATGAGASSPSKRQRVTLRGGRAQYSGRLYSDGVDTYVLAAGRGAVVQARIEGFTGRSAAVRVIDPAGRSLDRQALRSGSGLPSAPRVWNGTIREPGEYRIEVVRLASSCAPSFTYLLTIAVR